MRAKLNMLPGLLLSQALRIFSKSQNASLGSHVQQREKKQCLGEHALLEHTLKSSAVIRVRPPQERLRLYEMKVRKLESEQWLAHNSAQTQINVAAANRFISAAIPDLTATQRAALKTVRLPHVAAHVFMLLCS